MHQSPQHLVADAPWEDDAMPLRVRERTPPAMDKRGPVQARFVDDAGFPKMGIHSAVLQPTRQARERSSSGESFGSHGWREFADRLAIVGAGELGQRPEAETDSGNRGRNTVSKQACDRARSDPPSRRAGSAASAYSVRCSRKQRQRFPGGDRGTGIERCGGSAAGDDGLEARGEAVGEKPWKGRGGARRVYRGATKSIHRSR